ncbi:hypothetical protein JOD54_002218 [Actinokineospora baliensis]|uniref:hypothetical protein n=1 Tax=Actinokineospora baliensis TaxID=547056 RepID=UPI00195D4990|nr:hypothetical protein [Actinokineospora baliensis]MBM7772014.1 hypothetical protein [Actinokineospora baliensis]
MRLTGEPSERSRVPPAAPERVRSPLEILQGRVGNRAVQRLVALQREPTAEQSAEFDGYVKAGDWGRAAWVLNDWQSGDIAARLKLLSKTQLELLNEGAWHGGKSNVDAAVRAADPGAAIRGALRVLIWGKRWGEAATQLAGLGRMPALIYVRNLANQKLITGDELRQLVGLAPDVRLRPGDALTVRHTTYVVYATTVRFEGEPAWRNSNPGALKLPSPAIPGWGYTDIDPDLFLVFPDSATGQSAAMANLEFQAKEFSGRSIVDTMRKYASMPSDDPVAYANKIVTALGGPPVTRDTPFGSLTKAQLETVKGVIFATEKGKVGREVPHDSTELPGEIRDLLMP